MEPCCLNPKKWAGPVGMPWWETLQGKFANDTDEAEFEKNVDILYHEILRKCEVEDSPTANVNDTRVANMKAIDSQTIIDAKNILRQSLEREKTSMDEVEVDAIEKAAGKTSTLRSLMGKPFRKNMTSTIGAETNECIV